MKDFLIPHEAIVFVGDGRKALFLRNQGSAVAPDLRVEQVFTERNPPTHEQGTDRPGRAFAGPANGRRSSGVEQTDWHDLEEKRFAHEVAAALEKLVRERDVKAVVVAAPPRTLAELRQTFHADVRSRIVGEIDKDLTKQPVDQIGKHFAA